MKFSYIKVLKGLMALLLSSVFLLSCSKGDEPLARANEQKVELTKEEEVLRAYIDKHFTQPYNIDVIYKWEGQAKEIGSFAYPPRLDKALTVLKAIKYLWLDLCEEERVFTPNFLKGKAPIVIRLFGGLGLNASGLELITAPRQTAIEFYIYNVNAFDPKKKDDFFILYRSLLHQFAQRLIDLKTYDYKAFVRFSDKNYVASDDDIVTPLENIERVRRFSITRSANLEGFLTPYAMRSVDEDFADSFSMYLLATSIELKTKLKTNLQVDKDFYIGDEAGYEEDKKLAEQARLAIEGKLSFIKEYLAKEYKIKLDDLRLNTLHRLYEYQKYDDANE